MSNGYVPRQRSLAGPIVLILVGVVLLLAKMDVIYWGSLWERFYKYWPALLILWGIVKLVEYEQAKRAGVRAPGIGAGGIVFIIFLAMGGFSARKIHDLHQSGVFHIDDEDLPDFIRGEAFTFDDQAEQALTPGSALRIIDDHGAVNLIVADGDKIKVMVRKTLHADDQNQANKVNEQTKFQLNAVDKTVTLNANTGAAGGHGVKADMDVYVPRKVAVTIQTKNGDVSVMGRDGDIEITSQHGEVSVQDVAGNAKLSVDKSTVRVSKLDGDLSIDGKADDVTLSDIKGAVRLSGEFHENISLSRISKAVTFKTTRTDMEIANVPGTLDIDQGSLHGTSVVGPVRLLTKEKDIRLDGASGDIRISDNDGAVEVHVNKLPVGNLDITNRNADVQVYLPDHAGFKVDASTDNGEVESSFGELKVNNEDDHGRATGIVGNGAGSLRISNAHGGIEIRRGSEGVLEPPTPPEPPKPPKPPKMGAKGGDGAATEGTREF